jgi:2-succinyl-5-enolpyruvyl-6-hydroxy-3-cyclohexene-1-carboxylate synthase
VNQALAIEVIEALRRAGVRTVCLCPGGRNAPLVEVLEPLRQGGMEVLDFFDERGAAFFALGRARRDLRPSAVVTTSGTAAAELLPAMVEAYYQGAPLLALTADRPRSFRGTGAPQSIEQANLFGIYARQVIDLDRAGTRWHVDPCCWPVHVNVSFDEPLLEGWQPDAVAASPAAAPEPPGGEVSGVGEAAVGAAVRLRRPLVVLGALAATEDRDAAAAFCERLRAPLLAEASSHLRHRLRGLVLQGGETVAAEGLRRGWFDGVVRVGDIPSFRLWRDLERRHDLAVVSLSRLPWRGLTHGAHVQVPRGTPLPLDRLAGAMRVEPEPAALRAADERVASALETLLRRFPQSEPALVRQLSETIPAGSFVYLGNSLPIREWNQFSSDRPFEHGENRGANGIDGQLSTFLGWSGPGRENWAVVGDLTALYDLPSLWALPHAAGPVRIVVINNGGGRIFRRIFRNPRFQHDHAVTFDLWARMWDAAYSSDPGLVPAGEPVVVELKPDSAETERFWKGYEEATWFA